MADKEIAISVRDIHKEFVLPQSKNTSLKQSFVNIVRKNNKTIQKVLDGVSFDIYKGDFIGIVGRNGSGKSTLLKLLAGVYTPTGGAIEVNGGLTPFIELGVGFNPELSGRDNVYLNGALLGYDRKQMDEVYDEIVSFAELEPFMDQKLKNYSSGMQVRLAFSIAIRAKNDILVFDEVLAVGDEAFQRKCLDVFEQYKAEGQTVILVTHEMDTVKRYCNRAVLIHKGKLIEDAGPRKVASHYSRLNQEEIDKDTNNRNSKSVSILKVKTHSEKGDDKVSFKTKSKMTISLDWSSVGEAIQSVGVNIFKQTGEHITGANTLKDGIDLKSNKNASIELSLPLHPGRYYILAEVFKGVGQVAASNENDLIYFSVTSSEVTWSGLVDLPHTWKL